jgi:2-methylcitrate dehydratase PrpD
MAVIWFCEGMMQAEPEATRQLAEFLVESQWRDIPAAVRREAQRTVMNFVGTALGGCRDVAVELALRALGRFSGPAQATVIGRKERQDALSAAFLNSVSANVLEFDDTHLRTVIHPAAPVAPALFALSELRPCSGQDLLHALVLGVEAECRIGNAVSPAHYRQGWHITSTCGVFGAAAAVAKLLRLDRRRMAWALGNAAAQSAGLMESLGSMAKSISVGNAARNGFAAALLAEQGFTGAERAIEGTYGFAGVMSNQADLGAIIDGLGDSWEILANAYKPYPCGVVLFPVIDGCLELRERHALTADRIAGVTVRGHPLLRMRTDRPEVRSGREAKVSIQHSVAVAFLYGVAGLAQYADECVVEPAVLDLRRKVAVEEDESIPVETAFVTVHTTDGRTLVGHVTEARGTMARPMSDTELEAKFRGLAAFGAPTIVAQRLIEAIWGIEHEPHVGRIIKLTAPPASGKKPKCAEDQHSCFNP